MTTTPAAALRAALTGLTRPSALERDELLAAVTALGDAQAVLDAVKTQVAGELVSRSTQLGAQNPVARAGQSSAAGLLSDRWRIPMPAARLYCQVGEATRPGTSIFGEALPPEFAVLAAALAAPLAPEGSSAGASDELSDGRGVGVDQAAVIVRELRKAAPGCTIDDLQSGERVLVEHAPNLGITDLRCLAAQVRDRLDQDGVLPREDRQRTRRSLTISTASDGMTHIDWYLEPESAGYVVTAIDSLVGRALRDCRGMRFVDPGEADEAGVAGAAGERSRTRDDADLLDDGFGGLPQTRTLAQLRSDAATDVFRHLAACATDTAAADTAIGGRPPVTVMVRIGLDALQSGRGSGEIEGVPSPVSAGTVRRMAADANIIPVVLGNHSEVLDLGRSRRLFTTAQKRALAERDGGCAWTGCPHPPSYTEAHHIRWWNAHDGATDLDNGILLCSTHHHRVHDDGWDIDVRDHVPYFIPPDHVDPYRRPRRGGRVRLSDVA